MRCNVIIDGSRGKTNGRLESWVCVWAFSVCSLGETDAKRKISSSQTTKTSKSCYLVSSLSREPIGADPGSGPRLVHHLSRRVFCHQSRVKYRLTAGRDHRIRLRSNCSGVKNDNICIRPHLDASFRFKCTGGL